jgi:hypothetical protein
MAPLSWLAASTPPSCGSRLSKGKSAPDSHILIDSSKTPGLIDARVSPDGEEPP